MLVIGHRGAKGLAPENTIASLRAGQESGADILEFDVRITSDKIAILCHDPLLYGRRISNSTLQQLQEKGEVTTLESILDAFFGKVLLNLEFKPQTGIHIVYRLLTKKYIKNKDDWHDILISSFHVRPLLQLRRLSSSANLALLHSINPFAFVAYQRKLQLVAVGWHRLHLNRLAIEIARKSEIFCYVYTVNRPEAAQILSTRGIDAVVTDYPDIMSGIFND